MPKEPKPKEKLPLYRSLFEIFASVILISGSIFGVKQYFDHQKQKKRRDSAYNVTKIIQTGPRKDALKSVYLMELLQLSSDHPMNIYRTSEKNMEEALLKSPLIKEARVTKQKPDTLYIDYDICIPVAKLFDYKNRGIDEEGRVFPLEPFFSGQNLPEIYLGMDEFENPLSSEKSELAFELLKLIETENFPFEVKRIDVSNAFLSSYGRREIVLLTEDALFLQTLKGSCHCIFPKMLRLSPNNFAKQLGNFLVLRERMLNDYRKQVSREEFPSRRVEFSTQVIDFRIDELAFIQESS